MPPLDGCELKQAPVLRSKRRNGIVNALRGGGGQEFVTPPPHTTVRCASQDGGYELCFPVRAVGRAMG